MSHLAWVFSYLPHDNIPISSYNLADAIGRFSHSLLSLWAEVLSSPRSILSSFLRLFLLCQISSPPVPHHHSGERVGNYFRRA